MKRIIEATLSALVILLPISSCTSSAPGPQKIFCNTSKGTTVTVTAVRPDVIKVTTQDTDATLPATEPFTGSTLKIHDDSITATESTTLTTTAGISVKIDPETGSVDISAPNMSISDPGLRENENGQQQITLYAGSNGSFYGAGERGHSYKLNGDTLVMYNRQNYGYTKGDPRIKQMNITMPLFLSSEGYAVVFDDFAPATMIMSDPIVYTTEAQQPISYYIVYGDGNLPQTSRNLSEVIGRQDLPPLWALGYITSKYGYHTQDETLGVVDTLKRKGYPVDGIVLDLYWYGKEEDMGRLAWDSVQWPNPALMLDSLKRLGVNLVAISQPYVLENGRGIDNFKYLSSQGMLAVDSAGNTHPVEIWVGKGGMLDVSNPATRQWLRDRYKSLTDGGITGWWGDLGEPEVHPETAYHFNGLTARQYHNRYGNDWSRIIYDLYKEEYPDTRLMTLMRGGTTGLQQFSVFPWSTDVSRSWGGLQPQINIMLNSGLSGMGYMSHDVGGFAVDPEHPYDAELYVRWLQLGLFSPILRTHAQQFAEPYNYPQYEDIIVPLIQQRYRWLPYNYSLAYENALFGLPMVRPIEYYTGNTDADDVWDEYLWGRDLLVAPVMQQGATSRSIQFPSGSDRWIDINNTSAVYNGGTTVADYPAPLEVLPLFVREGAFIPSAPYKMDNTGDYTTNLYRIDYYPLEGSKSEYTLYEDDLTSPDNIHQGEYLELHFTGEQRNGIINVAITSTGSYKAMDADKIIEMVIQGVSTQPKNVAVDGKAAEYTYNKENNTLTVPLNYTVGRKVTLKVALS